MRQALSAVLWLAALNASATSLDGAFDDVTDYLDLSAGVEAIAACVEKQGLPASAESEVARIAAHPDFDAFVAQALALLEAAGQSESPAISASKLENRELRAAGMIGALSAFTKLDSNDDIRFGILQTQAAALATLRIAALAGDACVPPDRFLDLMRRIENEYY
jgi:hypothetical protein